MIKNRHTQYFYKYACVFDNLIYFKRSCIQNSSKLYTLLFSLYLLYAAGLMGNSEGKKGFENGGS